MEYNSSTKLKAYIKYEYGFPFLDLSRKGLSRVPDAVTELTELEVLKLDNNNLTELPTSINKLKNLVRLHLYSNRLTELPAEIGDLKKLNALYVSSNQLVGLPTSIQTLNKLEVLELDGNKLTELPSQIGDLEELKKLYVYNNQLVGLPTSVQKLNQLQDLNLSNNTLTELPAVIGDLKQLKSLHVSNNQLVSLPTSIQKLNQLEDLQLSCNKLTELPSEIGDLKELRRLDVSYNQLVSLPTSIQKLNQLEELHLYGNKFTELPSEIGDFTEKLRRLNARYKPLPSDAIHVLEMKKKGSMTSSVITDPASNPPEVTLPLLKTEDLPETGVPWDDGRLPTDILLLTVEDCEFLGCLSCLNSSFCRSYCKDLGYVYFGELERAGMKVKISVMKCYKGSITAGGSAVSVSAAVRVLRPKAVFLVGICHSLKSSEVKLGDVAISEMLITCVPSSDEVGDKVPLRSLLLNLIPNAGDGWKAPLKDPKALKVKIHRGDFLSVPGVIDNNECRETLIKRFPQAIAMELEGQGLYAAAHALDVPWIIIKGISDYADCRKSGTDRWRSFASLMAASLTAHILNDPVVFQDWHHYNETGAVHIDQESVPSYRPKVVSSSHRKRKKPLFEQTAETGMLSKAGKEEEVVETVSPVKVAKKEVVVEPEDETEVEDNTYVGESRSVITRKIKDDSPTPDELESLSEKISVKWKKLGRRLKFDEAQITEHDKNNDELCEKAYKLLLAWKGRDASAATYSVLHKALSDIQRKDLAEEFCCQ